MLRVNLRLFEDTVKATCYTINSRQAALSRSINLIKGMIIFYKRV